MYATFQCGCYNVFKIILNFFDPPKVKKQDLNVAHNQPKSFFFTVQPSQQPRIDFSLHKLSGTSICGEMP